ncbi:MAG: NAD(P)/FAD-dependent oxidoreductase [Candidatus Omnitrophica bacterium]|nr:NAD(P)/FAD-dependent oxidoreductase [Candidatus Omnitrophota bacterium]
MKNFNKCDYDVVIIGGGISGLICGCYLAKRGVNTLIVEKNISPGGYCASFVRQGFFFDACVCSLSGCGKDGSLQRIIQELDLKNDLEFINYEIRDIVITPNYKVNLYGSVGKTIGELQRYFPKQEKAIKKFFEKILFSPITSLSKMRNTSFKNNLDFYFTNEELKTILSIVLLGYTGVPPSRLSTLAAYLLYRDFIFDGGYYPLGGMQKFSNALANKFSEFGGTVTLATMVKKIILEDNIARGVILESGKSIFSKVVIAACDLHETFHSLIDATKVPKTISNRIHTRETSLSAFLVYLGISKDLDNLPDLKSHIWIINNNYNNIEKIYTNLLNKEYDYIGITSSSVKNNSFLDKRSTKESLFLFVNMPFVNERFWNENKKNVISGKMIKLAERLLPDITEHIKIKIIATPFTLFKSTLNYKGSAYGWADTTTQFCDPNFSQKTKIKNLYLTGHWLNRSSGVSPAAYSGIETAKILLGEIFKI